MGVLDAIMDSAVEAIKSEMASIIEQGGFEDLSGLNPGQYILLNYYAIPAMVETIDDEDGSGVIDSDALIEAAFDSHEAVEQALSDTVAGIADSISYLIAILQGADVVDFLDYV